MTTPNLALRYLADHNLSACDVDCVELAGEVAEAGGGKLIYFEPAAGTGLVPDLGFLPRGCVMWRHHAAALIGGRVHCPWVGRPLTISGYKRTLFPGQRPLHEVFG